MLPVIRRELGEALRPAHAGHSPPVEVCAIVEDGVFGYELAPQEVDAPFLLLGCAEDGIPRVRRTFLDPSLAPGLRLATLHGRAIDPARPRMRRKARQDEVLYADWPTAARVAWQDLAATLAHHGPHWDASMAACRSLENALAVSSLHLAEWDPAIDFCGLVHQAEYGFPLRSEGGGAGTLTLRRADLWLLQWRCGGDIVEIEFSPFSQPEGTPALLPRDARR